MRKYTLITLNMIEYIPEKNSAEYLNIQKCFRAGGGGRERWKL